MEMLMEIAATTTVTIGEPIKVTVSASATNVSCNGAADGTITAKDQTDQ
jgi:hypothetical protein